MTMPSSTHADIPNRFFNELDSILRFVDFLNSAIGVDRLALSRINSTLGEIGLGQFRLPSGGLRAPIEQEDLLRIVPTLLAIEKSLPPILKSYDDGHDRYDKFVQNDVSEANSSEFDKWVDYATTISPIGIDPSAIESLKTDLKNKIAQERALSRLDDRDRDLFVSDAAELAMKIVVEFRRDRLYELVETIEHLKFLGNFSKPEAEINAYRQSFILMMTNFDAAVFDLVRTALRKNFFPFVSYFGKDAKIALGDLGHFTTTDEFVDFVIEAQLKKRYLKDVLAILCEVGIQLVDTGQHTLVQLTELVLRRNLHLHNRGIVDRFYLDQDKNIHQLALNESAVIDEDYWLTGVELCRNCVNSIAAWIEKGAPVPKKTK